MLASILNIEPSVIYNTCLLFIILYNIIIMTKQICFSKKKNFYLNYNNYYLWHFRINLYLYVNNLFDFNIFKYSVNHTASELGININIIEN
jgi:hypothetical protein